MKKFMCLCAIALLAVAGIAQAAPKKVVAGPKGGRMLENEAPRAEFFVDKDRKVVVTFYDESLKAVPAGDQVVTVIAEPKTGKAKLEMEKKDGALVSKDPLPEGDGYNVVVLIKAKPDAKSQNFRVAYHDEVCGECKRAEYACICDGGHEHKEGDGHDHEKK